MPRPPWLRTARYSDVGIDCTPITVLYSDAKKIVLAMTKITDPLPMPNQMMVSGTQAMPAIACRNDSTGRNMSAT